MTRARVAVVVTLLAGLPASTTAAAPSAQPIVRAVDVRLARAQLLISPEVTADQLRTPIVFDVHNMMADDHTYLALDWPMEVFPYNGFVTFPGKLDGASPMLRIHFRSAAAHKYILDCHLSASAPIGANADEKAAAQKITVRAWRRKVGAYEDDQIVDAKMSLSDNELSLLIEPKGKREVKVWLEAKKAESWRFTSCEIVPVAN